MGIGVGAVAVINGYLVVGKVRATMWHHLRIHGHRMYGQSRLGLRRSGLIGHALQIRRGQTDRSLHRRSRLAQDLSSHALIGLIGSRPRT